MSFVHYRAGFDGYRTAESIGTGLVRRGGTQKLYSAQIRQAGRGIVPARIFYGYPAGTRGDKTVREIRFIGKRISRKIEIYSCVVRDKPVIREKMRYRVAVLNARRMRFIINIRTELYIDGLRVVGVVGAEYLLHRHIIRGDIGVLRIGIIRLLLRKDGNGGGARRNKPGKHHKAKQYAQDPVFHRSYAPFLQFPCSKPGGKSGFCFMGFNGVPAKLCFVGLNGVPAKLCFVGFNGVPAKLCFAGLNGVPAKLCFAGFNWGPRKRLRFWGIIFLPRRGWCRSSRNAALSSRIPRHRPCRCCLYPRAGAVREKARRC